jgi:peptide-methionine (S)-S-oxide reductase
VGYAGGKLENPNYYNLGDHSETIQMDYEPTRVSYQDLLDVFWESHTPTDPTYGRQYMSIIFYHNEEQKRLAEDSKAQKEAEYGMTVYTEIVPYSKFWLAEDYHQKYRLRNKVDYLKEYLAIYPNPEDFVNSTAVMRMNGYLGGNGRLAALDKELDSLGLSPEAQQKLREYVARYDRSASESGPTCSTGDCGS